MSELFSASFPPVPASVPAARHGVVDWLNSNGLDSLADDVGLLTSELVSNAVRHARTPVHLRVDWDGTRMLVEAMDRSDEPPRPQPMPQTPTGGRGLAIVAAVAQRWGFEPIIGGKLVWFEVGAPGTGGDRPMVGQRSGELSSFSARALERS